MTRFIFNELRARGYSVDVGVVQKRERVDGKENRSQLEVDFVANLGSERCYIQSALALPTDQKVDQEKASLRSIGDSFRKVVLVRDVLTPTYDMDGILTMSVYDFLLGNEDIFR